MKRENEREEKGQGGGRETEREDRRNICNRSRCGHMIMRLLQMP